MVDGTCLIRTYICIYIYMYIDVYKYIQPLVIIMKLGSSGLVPSGLVSLRPSCWARVAPRRAERSRRTRGQEVGPGSDGRSKPFTGEDSPIVDVDIDIDIDIYRYIYMYIDVDVDVDVDWEFQEMGLI